MPKRLILMRHAKSDWSNTDASDHARGLNERGKRACDAVGPWLAQHGHVPDEVLCSSSVRTRETWSALARHLPGAAAPTLRRDLYLAEPQTLFDALGDAGGDCVALLAHNPGIGAFAGQVLSESPDHADFARFPTLATLVVDFDIDDWSALAPGIGTAAAFIVPRDLTDQAVESGP